MPSGLFVGVASAALLAAATPAVADEQAAQPPQQAAAAAPKVTLGEIVVTAMRRPEILREVPISVTAVDAKLLAERHISDPSELVFAAPSLQVQSNNASPVAAFFSVRGIGTLAFVKYIEQSVGVDLDGVALVRPETGVLAFYDINDVEVLNGPQGMLFGKNASAGLINITTRNPQIGSFNGYVTGEYGKMTTPGDGNEYQGQAVVNIPVTSNSALRITGVYLHTDPFVKDVYTSTDEHYDHTEKGARVKYLWEPTSALSINLSADYARSDGIGPGETTDRYLAPGSVQNFLDAAVGVTPGPKNTFNSSDSPTNDRFESGGVQGTIIYAMPNSGSITNILAYRLFDERDVIDNDQHQINIEDNLAGHFKFSQLSEELRYSSPIGRKLEYQVGVYYLTARIYENATLAADLGMPAPPPPYIAILGLDATDIGHFESAAAFGQATYHVTNKLRFLAGARFTHDYVDNVTYSYPYPTLALVFPVGTIPKASVKTNNVSWRGSVQYDFTADVMGYVTVAHGYKGPGFNQFSALAVPPELSYLYEAGVKTRLFDNRASFSLAAFDEIFDHFQDQTFFPVAPFYAVLSAGRLDSRGFEAQVDARLTEELTISANVAYADAYFGSFPGDQCYTGEPAEGSPARNVCFQGHSDSTGNTLANSPRWSGTLAARYVHPLSNGLQLEAGGNLYFRSLVNYASDGNPNTIQGGFALLGLNLGVGAPDGDWQVTLFCRNCTDKRFVSYIEPYPLLSTDYGQQFGADSFRTVGVTFRKSF